MLAHGGKLIYFAKKYQIPQNDWLDLSTGVSPFTYSCQKIDDNVWNRLPEDDDGLALAASTYYGCSQLLAIAGSQAGIMRLPVVITTLQGSRRQEGEQKSA